MRCLHVEGTHIATTGGTIPLFNKVFKYVQIFARFYMVRQVIPKFWT